MTSKGTGVIRAKCFDNVLNFFLLNIFTAIRIIHAYISSDSFYEDVFPNGFDPFADPHDATVPETSLELISNSPGFFEDMTDLSQKYDNVEPEEALFELLRENESSGKATGKDNLDFSKHIQNSVDGSTSGKVQKKSDTLHTKGLL